MGRPRKKEIIPPEPIELIDPLDEYAKAMSKVEDEIEQQFPANLFRIVKKIAYEIGVVGLTEKEACMIADYPYEKFLQLKQQYPIVVKLVEVKDLEYKRNLLKSISTKAGSDDKLAMWLLTAKYPNEFNSRKGSQGAGEKDPQDLVGLALEFVRKSGDRSGLVSEESGRAFIIKGKKNEAFDLNNVGQILT